MEQEYRATQEQWASVEATQATAERDFNSGSSDTAILVACILELRARVEALEANYKPTPNPSQIRSSLVERVAAQVENGIACDREPARIARAAIREVAAWLVDQHADSDGFIQSNVGCVIGQLHEEAGSTLKKENFNA